MSAQLGMAETKFILKRKDPFLCLFASVFNYFGCRHHCWKQKQLLKDFSPLSNKNKINVLADSYHKHSDNDCSVSKLTKKADTVENRKNKYRFLVLWLQIIAL